MFTILFIHHGPPDKAALGAACVNSTYMDNVRAVVAADSRTPASAAVTKLLEDNDLPWPIDIIPVKEFNPFEFDLIISFDQKTNSPYPELPGNPIMVNWQVDEPTTDTTDQKQPLCDWQTVLAKIRQLVEDLFGQGYFNALIQARRNSELILDNLSEGIIAHGLNRRFFYLNHAAEEITGLTKKDIQGRDCHDIFPDRFCSSHCHFCDGATLPLFPTAPYPLTIKNQNGSTKLVEMSIVPLKDNNNLPIGVVASMKDITREHELATKLGAVRQFSGIIGQDTKMQEIYQVIRELKDSNVPVLIQGESGTGKELVASAIHNEGNRSKHRFVVINCGALPDSLLESELFGHTRGAFTGAIQDKKGRFELADGGTIFLDEIGDISPAMQVKLLRILQDGILQRLGSEEATLVDVRVVAATHKNLMQEIEAGRFREDLYYRLCVVPVHLPPLRQRKDDIPLLVDHFLKDSAHEGNHRQPFLTKNALDILVNHDWPGNIRELQNIIRYLLVRCPTDKIDSSYIPSELQTKEKTATKIFRTKNSKRKLTREAVALALQESDGNKVQAAKILGVGRATLYRFLSNQSN